MVEQYSFSLAVAEIRWNGHFLDAGRLPGFRGATLRGALGYHLRNTVCNSFQRKCSECFLRYQCAYSLFFEGTAPEDRKIMRLYDHTPQPFMFVLDARDKTDIQPNDPFVFGMRIFGNTAGLFPYIAYSLFEAGKKGIGQDHIRFETESIEQDGVVLYEKEGTTIHKPQTRNLSITEPAGTARTVKISLLSPLRIRSEGRTAKRLSFFDIAKAALRRLTLVNTFYGNGNMPLKEWSDHLLQLAERVVTHADSLRPFGFDRYSGRQERSVRLDGVTGDIVFCDVPPELLGLLKVMEIIGLGKSTSFGFGRIAVEIQ